MRFKTHMAWVLGIVWVTMLGTSVAGRAQDTPADTSAIDTEQAWEKVVKARDAAADDKHYEAVDGYLDALGNDASLVKVVAKEIAYQKLWREDADEAIFYFKRHLARHPDEDNREVYKGLALAYSWSGRQNEAVDLYRRLAAEDPADGGTRIGLGRSLIWNNQLKEGFAVLRDVEDDYPLGTGAGRESRRFLMKVLDTYTPGLEIRQDAVWDSDDLDIYRTTATASLTILGNKLLQIKPSYAVYNQPGQPTVSVPRLGAGFIGGLAHNWSIHAYGWLDLFSSKEPLVGQTEKLDWQRPGGDLWFTWQAHNKLRVDFGGSVLPVDTYIALGNHLWYKQANLSADWRLGRKFTFTAAGKLADYSDDNVKKHGLLRLFWRREGKWEIHAGPVVTYMDFKDAYPGGYWAPDWVRNGSLALKIRTAGLKASVQIDGSVGQEKELGAEAVTVGGVSARLGWRFHDRALLALGGGYSRSRFSSASGYSRTFANLSVRLMF